MKTKKGTKKIRRKTLCYLKNPIRKQPHQASCNLKIALLKVYYVDDV